MRILRSMKIHLCLALLIGATSMMGCINQQTHVERGELFTPGLAPYDAFFAKVHTANEDATRARYELEGARAELVRQLELDIKTDLDRVLDAANKRAGTLKAKNIRLHLRVAPKVDLVQSGVVDASTRRLLDSIESAAMLSLELSSRLAKTQEGIAALQTERAELLGTVAQLHIKPAKRDQIKSELTAADATLKSNADELGLWSGISSKFVLDLARAIDTAGTYSSAASSAPEPAAKPARPAARRPAARQPRPATPPAPKPAKTGGDDFEP